MKIIRTLVPKAKEFSKALYPDGSYFLHHEALMLVIQWETTLDRDVALVWDFGSGRALRYSPSEYTNYRPVPSDSLTLSY